MNPYIPERSLWTGITRDGGGLRSHVRIRQGDLNLLPETAPITSGGINVGRRWLPLLESSELGLQAAQEQANLRRIAVLGATAALSSALTLEGCWVSNEFHAGTEEHVNALWQLAECDIKHEVLDTPEEIEQIHVCDDPGCLNPRHYNFTPKIAQRSRKAYPEYEHFTTDENTGLVIPDWYKSTGEYLPPVAESVELFLELRAQCVPYTDGSDAPFTANGISKIAIDPFTGCWVTHSYYLNPVNEVQVIQKDGYARIGSGKGLQRRGQKSGHVGAHILMAAHYNIDSAELNVYDDVKSAEEYVRREVNHKCGTRHCCNPEHLEMTTRADNLAHSQSMQRARRMAAELLNQPPLIP